MDSSMNSFPAPTHRVAREHNNQNSKIDAPEVQATANSRGHHLEVLTTGTESEPEATLVRQRVDAFIVKPDSFFINSA
jgi:hypothetical protein